MIVFRAFRGEVILGKISSSSVDGIRGKTIHIPLSRFRTPFDTWKVHLGFFNDVFIPGDLLFPDCEL